MIARGERPGFHVTTAQDGRWTVLEAPWLHIRSEALNAARAAIVAWLEVEPDSFDVEA